MGLTIKKQYVTVSKLFFTIEKKEKENKNNLADSNNQKEVVSKNNNISPEKPKPKRSNSMNMLIAIPNIHLGANIDENFAKNTVVDNFSISDIDPNQNEIEDDNDLIHDLNLKNQINNKFEIVEEDEEAYNSLLYEQQSGLNEENSNRIHSAGKNNYIKSNLKQNQPSNPINPLSYSTGGLVGNRKINQNNLANSASFEFQQVNPLSPNNIDNIDLNSRSKLKY